VTLATAGHDGVLRLWNVKSGAVVRALEANREAFHAVLWTRDGKGVISGGRDGVIRLWDPATGKELGQWKGHRGSINGLALSRDGKLLASAGQDRLLRLWGDEPGTELRHCDARIDGAIEGIALSPDGRELASASSAAVLRLWETDKAKEVLQMAGHPGGGLCVAFSPDGRRVVSGGKEPMIRVWETASGQERRRFGGYAGWVRAVAFSHDGKFIASGHHDGKVRLWDASSGKELAALDGHRGPVKTVAFGPGDKMLASGSLDTTALVWDVSLLLREARLPLVKLSDAELTSAWLDLADNDGAKAGQTVQLLARAPDQTVAWFVKHVRPIDGTRISKLLRDLDADEFATREAARAELGQLGEIAAPSLRKAMESNPSPELRRSIEELLEMLKKGERTPEWVRLLRAVEVLEMIQTPAATKHLETLATGAAEARLTAEAKAALARLRSQEKP
jgi:WD40 repeat protein